eukprot:955066-Rhodomonas_salina.1
MPRTKLTHSMRLVAPYARSVPGIAYRARRLRAEFTRPYAGRDGRSASTPAGQIKSNALHPGTTVHLSGDVGSAEHLTEVVPGSNIRWLSTAASRSSIPSAVLRTPYEVVAAHARSVPGDSSSS